MIKSNLRVGCRVVFLPSFEKYPGYFLKKGVRVQRKFRKSIQSTFLDKKVVKETLKVLRIPL